MPSKKEIEASKKQAVMSSTAFREWWSERRHTAPLPSNPYQAFMIDYALKAKLHSQPEWSKSPNRRDFITIDYPPIEKGKVWKPSAPLTPANRDRVEQARKIIEHHASRISSRLGIPTPAIRLELGQRNSQFSGSVRSNLATGKVEVLKREVTIGLGKSGKVYPIHLGGLAHELGHALDFEEMVKGGIPAIHARRSRLATRIGIVGEERSAWTHAQPFLKELKPVAVQKWYQRYAIGTYLKNSPQPSLRKTLGLT